MLFAKSSERKDGKVAIYDHPFCHYVMLFQNHLCHMPFVIVKGLISLFIKVLFYSVLVWLTWALLCSASWSLQISLRAVWKYFVDLFIHKGSVLFCICLTDLSSALLCILVLFLACSLKLFWCGVWHIGRAAILFDGCFEDNFFVIVIKLHR